MADRFVIEGDAPATAEKPGRFVIEGEKSAASEKPSPEPSGTYGNALADLFGVSGRPGAVPLSGRPGFETPAGVWAKPGQNVTGAGLKAAEGVASSMIDLGMLGAAGGGVTAPTLKQVALMAGGLGGAKAQARGETAGQSFGDAIVDSALSLVPTAAAKGATKLGVEKLGLPSLQALGRRVLGYEGGTAGIKRGAAAVVDQLPLDTKPWLEVPSLGKGLMTFQDAIKKLLASSGETFDVARREIVSGLNRVSRQLEKAGVKPRAPLSAGTRFNLSLPEFRRAPTRLEQFARGAVDVAGNPLARTAASAAATGAAAGSETEIGEAAAGAGLGLAGKPGELLRWARSLHP